MMQQRQTAFKVWLSSLLNGNFTRQEGEWEPNYVECNGIKVSRVNVIGTVVAKFISDDNSYASITVDDGSAAIRLKTFKEDNKLVEALKLGDLIMSIARVKEYNHEIYLSPEIVKVLDDPHWELLRKLELLKLHGKMQAVKDQPVAIYNESQPVSQPQPEEKVNVEEMTLDDVTANSRQKLLSLIEKNQGDAGAEIQSLIGLSGISEEEVNSTLSELLKEGEIYQSKPGFVKIV